jgi:hypothetical protein
VPRSDKARRLYDADRALCTEAAKGRMPIAGRRGKARGKFMSLRHEALPPTFFLDPPPSRTGDGQRSRTPRRQTRRRFAQKEDAPDYGDLRSLKVSVLRLRAEWLQQRGTLVAHPESRGKPCPAMRRPTQFFPAPQSPRAITAPQHLAARKATSVAEGSGRSGQRRIRPALVLAWSAWRRAHQASARRSHLTRRPQL